MKKWYASVMLILLIVSLFAWELNTSMVIAAPAPNASTALMAVDFTDAKNGWAVGASGIILKTKNGGVAWHQVKSPFKGQPLQSCTLYDVDFVDLHNGWVVGQAAIDGVWYGIIEKTSDGGKTWHLQKTWVGEFEYHNLYSVYFINALEGWVGGRVKALFHTTNGGLTWSKQSLIHPSALQYDIFDIQFVDSEHGWMSGSDGIWRTTDAGASWGYTSLPSGQLYYGLDFVNGSDGWMVSGYGQILHTVNGGAAWAIQFDYNPSIEAVDFVDRNAGWTVGTDIMHTTNGGTNWQLQSNPASYLLDVKFLNDNEGWAVGQIDVPTKGVTAGQAIILHTIDGGLNWKTQFSNAPMSKR